MPGYSLIKLLPALFLPPKASLACAYLFSAHGTGWPELRRARSTRGLPHLGCLETLCEEARGEGGEGEAPSAGQSFYFLSYKKKDGEWSTSQGRIKELEVLFHRSEAELTATLSEKQSLEAEVADARAQLAKVLARQAGGQLPSEAIGFSLCNGPAG